MPSNAALAILMPLVSAAAMGLTGWLVYAMSQRRHAAWKRARKHDAYVGIADDGPDLFSPSEVSTDPLERSRARKAFTEDVAEILARRLREPRHSP
jgi:hypothetical protein